MGTVEALRGQLCVGNRVGVLSLLARSSLLEACDVMATGDPGL